MLPEYSAQFIDVDKCFGAVGLNTGQTSSQSVPELHGRQIVGGGFGMLGLEKGQHLRAVLGERRAVLHKLKGRDTENMKEEAKKTDT